MSDENAIADFYTSLTQPIIRTIGTADLKDALVKGLDDFKEKPSHLVFLGLIYTVLGLIFYRAAFGYGVLQLLFPLLAGFILIGPVASIGLYELSRRREQGLDVSYKHAFGVLRSPSIGAIVILAIVLALIFFAWLVAAQNIHTAIFGEAKPESIEAFARQVLTTPDGWKLIIISNGVGILFGIVVLAIGAVSFPLLVDRKVGVVVAIFTSLRAFFANPITMLIWGIIVAATLFIGAIPLFVGLAVMMPVLGHATWHLYRKVVAH